MRKLLVVKLIWIMVLAMLSLVMACTPKSSAPSPGSAMNTVAMVAASAPTLAKQFDDVYNYLVQQKLVPDYTAKATAALAAMDAVAPLVQQGAQALTGDNFNWASFVLQSTLTIAQAMGYILPLVL